MGLVQESKLIRDFFIEVRYVTADGWSGNVRMYMRQLINWKADHPIHLIIGLEKLS
jgi:hypothetical protein